MSSSRLEIGQELLTTTRSVRLRLDLTRPVPRHLIEECLEIATQAPTATNTQLWRFVVITDAAVREKVAAAYRNGFGEYWAAAKQPEYGVAGPNAPQTQRMIESARYLVDNLQHVPVHVLFCSQGKPNPASQFELATAFSTIVAAAWSFMLAAHTRGLACCWTTVHLLKAEQVAQAVGLPDDVMQAVLLPLAYYTGDGFKPAPRIAARELTYWNHWGSH